VSSEGKEIKPSRIEPSNLKRLFTGNRQREKMKPSKRDKKWKEPCSVGENLPGQL